MAVKWWAVFSSRLCCSLLLLLQHCPCTFPFTVFLWVWFPCGLCLVLLPEHLCSAKAWKTPPIRTQMWAHAECVCTNTEQCPEGHLPKIGHMEGDDAIGPQLRVLVCEMASSQIKQQAGNYAWLLTQRSHAEKRYERHIKKLWTGLDTARSCPTNITSSAHARQSIIPESTGGACIQMARERTAALWTMHTCSMQAWK